MKTFELPGIGVDSLVFAERPMPPVGPRELLLRVRAAALNYRDLAIARGEYGTVSLPLVLGSDAVGEAGIRRSVTLRSHSGRSRESYEGLARALSSSDIRPVVDRVFDFDAAREAFTYLAGGAQFGKIVIRV